MGGGQQKPNRLRRWARLDALDRNALSLALLAHKDTISPSPRSTVRATRRVNVRNSDGSEPRYNGRRPTYLVFV
eukprot:5111150-Lingulodinium_polyedra.AAC.1